MIYNSVNTHTCRYYIYYIYYHDITRNYTTKKH